MTDRLVPAYPGLSVIPVDVFGYKLGNDELPIIVIAVNKGMLSLQYGNRTHQTLWPINGNGWLLHTEHGDIVCLP